MTRQDKTWDGVPVPGISIEDLDDIAFSIFRKKAKNSGCADDDVLIDTNQSLLENLDLNKLPDFTKGTVEIVSS
jgi:ATP-dependent DNA helicase RecG